MILIADSGSTKAAWCLTDGKSTNHITTQGISPYFVDAAQILDILKQELLAHLPDQHLIEKVYYYGTGCDVNEGVQLISSVLKTAFPNAEIDVADDLLGASRALSRDEKGVVSILGTGSNSCYYDGSAIASNKPGLGYVLGDEGSGAYLGIRLLRKYLYRSLPEPLRISFEKEFNATEGKILEELYSHPLPNRFLASFAHFLGSNRGEQPIEDILVEGLNDFFVEHLKFYKESSFLPLHFTGSIAWHFSDVIEKLCKQHDFTLGRIVKAPMEDLVKYHLLRYPSAIDGKS